MKLMEDECLSSFLVRKYATLRTGKNLIDVLPETNLAIGIPVFHKFERKFLKDIINQGINISNLVKKHTLYRLYTATSNPSFIDEKDIFNGRDNELLNIVSIYLPLCETKRIYSLRICKKCTHKQIKEYGFNWIKSTWSNPYINFCHKHNIELSTLKINPKNAIYNGLLTPEIDLNNYHETDPDNLTFKFSKLFYDIQNSDIPYFDLDTRKIIAKNICNKFTIKKNVSIPDRELEHTLWNIFKTNFELDQHYFYTKQKEHPLRSYFHGGHNEIELRRIFRHGTNNGSALMFWSLIFLTYETLELFLSTNPIRNTC